ncbi:MAG: ERAP1-like C-terminal domain-containing protein, partial [Pseudomonadota bacterium]
ARDPAVRDAAMVSVSEALTDDGVAYRTLEPLTLRTALTVAVQDGDAEVRQRLLNEFLRSNDSQFRANALSALGHARDTAFATALRERAMAGDLRANEIEALLRAQVDEPNARNDAWRFVRDRYADLLDIMPPRHAARLPRPFAVFCTEDMVEPVRAVFAPYVDEAPGAQRELDKAIESLENCAARAATERAQVRAAFSPGMRR